MHLTHADVERLFPCFIDLYREGGNNVLELQIPGCQTDSADDLCRELARSAPVCWVTDLEGDQRPDQLAQRLQRLAVEPTEFLSVSAMWNTHLIVFQATANSVAGQFDICLMYKDPAPLLTPPFLATTAVPLLTEYLQLGVDLCAAARGRGVVLTESDVPSTVDELPPGALLVWKNTTL